MEIVIEGNGNNDRRRALIGSLPINTLATLILFMRLPNKETSVMRIRRCLLHCFAVIL